MRAALSSSPPGIGMSSLVIVLMGVLPLLLSCCNSIVASILGQFLALVGESIYDRSGPNADKRRPGASLCEPTGACPLLLGWWPKTLHFCLKNQSGMLAQRMELDLGPLLLHGTQGGAVIDQQRRRIDRIERHAVRVGLDEFFQFVGVF